MATPLWINYKELRTGVSDPNGHPDNFNRPNRTIWNNFVAHGSGATGEHDKDGDHCSDLTTGIWKIETGTYIGNATDNRTISLVATTLDVKYVRIWSQETAYCWFATETFPYDIAVCTSGAAAADHIQTMGTGSFEIGASDDVNENLITFYYVVYGV